MKSTYKLLGLVWDGIPAYYVSLRCSDSLTLASANKSVSLKDFLSANSGDERAQVLSNFNNDEPIIVDFDYCCESSNPVISAFLKKSRPDIIFFN